MKKTSTVQLVRNATLKIRYAGHTMLIDPILADKGTLISALGVNKTPRVHLTIPIQDIIGGVDMVLLTHNHIDHYEPSVPTHLPKEIPIGEIAHSCHEPHMRTGRIDDAQFSFHVFRHGKVVGNVETAVVVTGIAVRASYSAPYHYVHVFYQGFNADTHNTTVSPSSGIISRLMSAS
jgi:glyoxylase-like metal-dependent hydrolase (beta-lactamase superfamily II)